MRSNNVTGVTSLCSEPRVQNTETISSPAIKVNQSENDGLLRHSVPHNDSDIPSKHSGLENWWRKFRDYFRKPTAAFNKVRSFFTMGLNIIGVVLNFGAVIVKGVPTVGPKVKDWLDKKSEWFSRYVIPFSFAWNGMEAAAGNRFVEAAARLVPAALFWMLPFYNFNMATGISSSINYLLHLIDGEYKGKTPDDSPLGNTKAVFSKLGEMISGIATKKWTVTGILDGFTVLGMLGGSTGGLAFANKVRDSWPARLFGLVRSSAGFTGDARFVQGNDLHKRFAGALMMVASVLNVFMRWVGDDTARILNHLSIALDDFGLTYWVNESKRRNDSKIDPGGSILRSQPRVQNYKLHLAPELVVA